MKKTIPEATRAAILDAAWAMMERTGRQDIAMAEIAAAAGVSRQTLFYAFGNRSGLLLAMVRHKDSHTDHVSRMNGFRTLPCTPENFLKFVGIWLDYLPIVYPVAILLDAAAVTEAEAALAIGDRMKGALRTGLRRQLEQIGAMGGLHPGQDPQQLADVIWTLVHPQAWRLLVVECGWTAEAFRQHRLDLIAGWFPALAGSRAG
jgi:AcrR family transcriptional regulator